MGDLRDQLKKAKLISDKEARRLAHEERVHRKEVGREGLEREQEQRRAELEQMRASEREQTHKAQEDLDRERRDAAERAACADILREANRPSRGQQRWYFQLDDGSLPYLEVDEALRFQLQAGAFWIARVGAAGSHVYGLLPPDLGRRVARCMPEVIAWAPGGARAIAAAAQ